MTRPNVVIIAIDTLRPDHLGCYGYRYPTSPNIDALASESMVFDRAFAPAIPTMPSFTTLHTGLHPYRHGITAHSSDQRLSHEIVPMAEWARRSGYVTIGIDNLTVQGNGRGSWFARGFDFYSGFLYKPFSNQSEQLVERAFRFLEDFQESPFFLFIHLWDPHTPYGPPPPYDRMHFHPEEKLGPPLSEVVAISPEYYTDFLGEMKLAVPDSYEYVVAQYDGEISYVDQQVGRLVARLKEKGLWDNSVVVLMSDHGECFGEGNIHFDHHGLYDAVMRVALMCKTPGGQIGRQSAMVSTEDIFPTLAEYAGWELPSACAITGRSFQNACNGEEFSGRERIIGVESTRQASLCLRTEQWKFILPIIEDVRGNPLTNLYGELRDRRPLLYNLTADPGEREDVSNRYPAVTERMGQELSEWRAAEVARRGGSDPVIENGLSLSFDFFMERLRSRRLFTPG